MMRGQAPQIFFPRTVTACSEYRRRTLNRKEQLRHRAVSLRQHGFLVLLWFVSLLFGSVQYTNRAGPLKCSSFYYRNFSQLWFAH